MIIGIAKYGGNGWLGVCTRCVDLVPLSEKGGCGNDGHVGGQRQPWTPTRTHKLVHLATPGAAFCRACRVAVRAGKRCTEVRWAE